LKYAVVAEYFEKLEQTSGRLQMTEILSDLFKETPKAELPILAYLMQGKLRPTLRRSSWGIAEKLALRVDEHRFREEEEQEVKDAYIKGGRHRQRRRKPS